MSNPFFPPRRAPQPQSTAQAPQNTGGGSLSLILVIGAVAALWFVLTRTAPPGPGPSPNPRPVIGKYAEIAWEAGRLEDRLYADVFDSLADRTERKEITTADQWQKIAQKELHAARLEAQHAMHDALNEIFPTNAIEDSAKASAAQRSIADGFRRSGQ